MKLRYSPTSPFVRKVRVMLLETGLDDRVERIKVNPMNRDDMVNSPNPLGKIPCLETDDGLQLYDSPVIVDYLDTCHDGAKMIPPAGRARWDALRRQALGDGIMDNVQAVWIENLRREERRSRAWIGHNKASAERAVDALEGEADSLDGPVDIGRITVAVALAFYDQHHGDEDWRGSHPALAAWFDAFNARPSMTETVLIDTNDYR